MTIEESVHRLLFGATFPAQANIIEADVEEKIQQRGLPLNPGSPWYFHCGSFERIYIDPSTGESVQPMSRPRNNLFDTSAVLFLALHSCGN